LERWRHLRVAGLGAGACVVAFCSDRTGDVYWCSGDMPGLAEVTPASLAYGASVTKQMVGVLAAQAVVEGGLRIGASVRYYLPELPAWLDPIRVRHLLHHTGGLPQPPALAGVLGLSSDLRGWSRLDNAAVLAALHLFGGARGTPGAVFSYDNTGYVLLAEVIAAVRGSALSNLARTDLFHPLGMSGTRLGGPSPTVLTTHDSPPRTVGDGGLWTDGADLLRRLKALKGSAFGAELTALVQTPGRLDDGAFLGYAWGMAPRPGPGSTVSYIHGGSWPGWAAMTVRNPSAGTAVAILAHTDDAGPVSSLALDLHLELLSSTAPTVG
jgi:CubicO group peptidase (beta-lactamase class C family)